MDILPVDVILYIITKLSYKNIISLCRISKRYYKLLSNDLLWKNKLLQYKCNINDKESLRVQYLLNKAQTIKNENIKMRNPSQKKEKYLLYMQLGRKLIPINTEYKYIKIIAIKNEYKILLDILDQFLKNKTSIFLSCLHLQKA